MSRMTRLHPIASRQRRTAAGNQRVDMGVMFQTLIPSMQNQRRRRLDAEGFFEYFAECLPKGIIFTCQSLGIVKR